MKKFPLSLYQLIFLLKTLVDATAQPAAKGTDHIRNTESQKFYQASTFDEEQTKTQDKDTINLQQIPCSRKENLALTDNTKSTNQWRRSNKPQLTTRFERSVANTRTNQQRYIRPPSIIRIKRSADDTSTSQYTRYGRSIRPQSTTKKSSILCFAKKIPSKP